MKNNILIILLIILPMLAMGQDFPTDTYYISNDSGEANGGTYYYNAKVKARMTSPWRIQFSIISFEITDFKYKGRYTRHEGFNFPIALHSHQANLVFSTHSQGLGSGSMCPTIISKKVRGVQQGALDFYDLTKKEKERYNGYVKTLDDIDLIRITYAKLINTYFEELSPIRDEIDKLLKSESNLDAFIDINRSVDFPSKTISSNNKTLTKAKMWLDKTNDFNSSQRLKNIIKSIEEANVKILNKEKEAEKSEFEKELDRADERRKAKEKFEAELYAENARIDANLAKEKLKKKQKEEAELRKKEMLLSDKQRLEKKKVEVAYAAMHALSQINVPDAELERRSLALTYGFSDFHELGIRLGIIADWSPIFLSTKLFVAKTSYDAWAPIYTTTWDESWNDFKYSGNIQEGDIAFRNSESKSDENYPYDDIYKHMVLRKKKFNSFGGGLQLGLGFRFNIADAHAIRISAEGIAAIYTGHNKFAYSFILEYEIGKLTVGLARVTAGYGYFSDYGYGSGDIKKITNIGKDEYTTEEEYNYNGNTIHYYELSPEDLPTYYTGSVGLKYFELSIAYKL